MRLFDTHTHLDAPQFDEDREEVISRAREAGVTKMINIGFNRETIPTTMKLAETYDYIYAAVGWHPVDAIDMMEGIWNGSLRCAVIRRWLPSGKSVWIITGILLRKRYSIKYSASRSGWPGS